ncbi:hypothetical protein GCM10009840_19450 [Pseudolysinimonas kribbensis]|uniref:FtsK/SpoIIIE domain-containing protein n=1 Tax=Pseudolysinimonas kribbensis TaxID=433641 RepID=UPI0031D4112B
MLPPVDPVRLALPSAAPPPERGGVPLVATLAPVAMSLAIWAFTHSVLSLLFAGLGPIVAIGGLVDARRRHRRWRRREHARIAAALARTGERIEESHVAERARRAGLVPPEGPAIARWAVEHWVRPAEPGAPVPVRVGRGAVASGVRLEGDDPTGDADAGPAADPRDRLPPDLVAVRSALRSAAAELPDAPVLVDAVDGVGIVGPGPLAAAAARALVLQVASIIAPDGVVAAPAGEAWTGELPQERVDSEPGRFELRDARREVLVAWASEEAGLPPGCGAVVRLDAARRVSAVSRPAAAGAAAVLAEAAARHHLGAATRALPDRVELAELLAGAGAPAPGSLTASIGRDAGGAVVVDLVADGPHALVGGTTGSGKSELLVSWVLALAHGRTPAEVTFLLVDFKGGAAFAPLAAMPHVVGILSDLDARLTRRAIESLRAELLRRERLLADVGARSIAEVAPGVLARLVVVVDEFAAVVAGQPELHEVFGDLAARGRSLGLHLILCTQRPAGVIRDGVLANVTLRVGLRMTDRADSIALLGDDGAARLPAGSRGRAVLGDDGVSRPFQVAIAGTAELEQACRAVPLRDRPAIARPWLDPLPAVVPRNSIGAATSQAIPFGVVDLPAEQRQPVAVHRPDAHGHLLVLGATGTGRTTALAVLAAAPGAIVVPRDVADAWWVLDRALRVPRRGPGSERRLLVIDDLDLLLGRAGPDERHELSDLIARVLREGSAHGLGVAASVQRAAGTVQPLVGSFGARLLLRMPSREEHVLAGGIGAEFDPALPPGAGRWRGAAIQVAWPGEMPLPEAAVPELPVVAPAAGRQLAIVASRPALLLPALRAAGLRVALLGAADPDEDAIGAAPDVLLGDPDAWQADWSLLGRARRELPIAVVDCSAAELRALTRARDVPPPLGSRPGECWVVDGGVVRRGLLPTRT